MNKKRNGIDFSNSLIKWFETYGRNLSFRKSKDPYSVWLSEIILQQTQMETGLKYYDTFIKKFPKIKDLAEAKEEEIYNMWQGLGYYNRAKNLHKTAILISEKMGGVFPKNYDELLKLPGVGRYTAAAISSICYNERKFVVDANVFRVLSRYYGINKNISNSNAYSFFEDISLNIGKNIKSVGVYNEAIMDFGGSVCTSKKPNCDKCVIRYSCIANRNDKQNFFPIKNKRGVKKNRYFNYFILENDELFLMQKRKQKDIWLNLNEFYLLEEKNKQKAVKNFLKKIEGHKTGKLMSVPNKKKGVLSHQNIHINFFKIFIPNKNALSSIKKRLNLKFVNKTDINKYAVPKVIDNYLKCHC